MGHRDPRHTSRHTRTASRRFEGLWKKPTGHRQLDYGVGNFRKARRQIVASVAVDHNATISEVDLPTPAIVLHLMKPFGANVDCVLGASISCRWMARTCARCRSPSAEASCRISRAPNTPQHCAVVSGLRYGSGRSRFEAPRPALQVGRKTRLVTSTSYSRNSEG